MVIYFPGAFIGGIQTQGTCSEKRKRHVPGSNACETVSCLFRSMKDISRDDFIHDL